MTWKLATGVLAVVALVLGAAYVWPGFADDDPSAADGDASTIVIDQVERRDLTEEITVRGDIRRDELQRITSGIDGRVSSVLVDDGDTVEAGDVIFALDGRAAVAVNGDFSFFRQLDVGSDGPDVLQLEQILAADGYQVGLVDQLYTEETRAGLRQWQIDHGYGGATPEPEENIVVALQPNSAGYSVGARNTISIELAPSVPAGGVTVPVAGDTAPDDPADPPTQDPSDDPADDEESLGVFDGPSFLRAAAQVDPTPTADPTAEPTPEPSPTAEPTPEPTATPPPEPAKPVIEVRVSPVTVDEGQSATFTFTSNVPMPTDTVVDFVTGGDATAGDDYDDTDLNGSFVFPAGRTSVDIVVPTLADDDVESDEQLTVEVGTGVITNDTDAYVPGPLKEARLTITSPSDEMQTLTVEAAAVAVNEGGTVSFTIDSDLVRNEATTVAFTLGGSARSGSDYAAIDLEIDLPANGDSVTVSIATRNDTFVEGDETISLTLAPSPDNDYRIGRPSSASVVIESDDLPELTIEGGGSVGEGEGLEFIIRADQAVTVDTSINYSVGGSATPGRDYKELAGTVVMPAGANHVHVAIQTIDDDVLFQPGDMVVAEWPARIGTVSVDEGEFILLGQEVLTLTEPTFTITLRLTPTERGRLDAGMNVMVELQASDEDPVPGFIASLDDNATVDDAGEESYEGVVETIQPLEAVDGARVNVDVTLQERLNVITVPVAAVLQDGEGNDVVRVVTTDRRTRMVAVEVGLTEGAFVEIREGLDGDELVVIET